MITINLDKLPLSAAARDVLDDLTDFTPLLQRLARGCEKLWEEKFDAQGPGWAPLSEVTLKRRRKAGKGAVILKDDGRLFASLESASTDEDGIYSLDSTHLTIGTNLKYASAHQDSRRSWLPKRPFLPTPDEVVPVFEAIIQRWAEGVGKR